MQVCQFINQDVRERVIAPTMREDDSTKRMALRKKIAEEDLPAKFAVLEQMIGPSGYLVGDKLSMADINFYVCANWIGMGVLDGVPKETITQFPKLLKLIQTLDDHPQIKAWNAEKNPKLPCF